MAYVSKGAAEEQWRKFNKDDDDTLTVDEVKQCLIETLGEEDVDDAEVKKKFKFFGQDEPKNLTKDEFVNGMMRLQQFKTMTDEFKHMDKDGNGVLSKEELEKGLETCGYTGEVKSTILEELEFDDDGKYNIEEFKEAVLFGKYFAANY